jgi:hypothetical protein
VSSLGRRLSNLEARHGERKEAAAEAEERRKEIRKHAEHANRCMGHRIEHDGVIYGKEGPLFEITESGDVLCTHDGKPVTNAHQTLAEEWYWMEVGCGGDPELIHDEEAQAFYTRAGNLALSRDYVDLSRLMGGRL